MSPRHFSRAISHPVIKMKPDVDYGPNLWYAFTRITGIANLFVYTPKEITNHTAKHGEARVDKTTPDTQNPL